MREDLRKISVNLIKKSSTGNNSIFNDFIKTRSEFPSRQSLQEFRVRHNDDRLVEGSDEVLAQGMIGAHLATEQYEVGNADLDKERGVNFEGTVRWRGDNGFGIGANLFHTEFDGFIYLTPGQTLEDDVLVDEIDELPVYLFVQQDASFTGGEIYADYTLQDGPLGADWRAEANVDFVSSDIDGGGDVPLLPPTTFNASLDGDWGLWKAGASVTVAGDQDDPGEGQLPTDGYTTLDLRGAFSLADVGFGSEGTELFLEARNVTDEEVRYATSVLKDTVPAPGRNIRGGVRIVF